MKIINLNGQWKMKCTEERDWMTAQVKYSAKQKIKPGSAINTVSITIQNPQLWWPNGFGSHPLYHVEVTLKDDKQVCDMTEMNIGLRTIKLRRDPDSGALHMSLSSTENLSL